MARVLYEISQIPWHTVGQSNQECKETSEPNVWVM